jgi:hypothetical protein
VGSFTILRVPPIGLWVDTVRTKLSTAMHADKVVRLHSLRSTDAGMGPITNDVAIASVAREGEPHDRTLDLRPLRTEFV